MWESTIQEVDVGRLYRLREDGSPLSFKRLFALLEHDPDFGEWYSQTLAASGLTAFFWEHPPLSTETFDDDSEFVLVESSSLATLQPDLTPFESQFAVEPGADIVTFPNLGGDALLIVPRPVGPAYAYLHLMSFLRHAPSGQIASLWQRTGRTVRESITASPRWLSTAGLGVAWLHLRIDTRPKYYRYRPYKDA